MAIKTAFEEGDMAVALDQFAPLLRVIEIRLGNFFGRTAVGRLTNGSEGVEMGINDSQLLIVVGVGVLVSAWVTGIVHAGAEIGIVKILILVVEAESVADFLTNDHLSPGWTVVIGGIEISIVHLGHCLSDMETRDPDLGDTKPAVVAVFRITNFDPAAGGATAFGVGPASSNGGIEDIRNAPVGRSCS